MPPPAIDTGVAVRDPQPAARRGAAQLRSTLKSRADLQGAVGPDLTRGPLPRRCVPSALGSRRGMACGRSIGAHRRMSLATAQRGGWRRPGARSGRAGQEVEKQQRHLTADGAFPEVISGRWAEERLGSTAAAASPGRVSRRIWRLEWPGLRFWAECFITEIFFGPRFRVWERAPGEGEDGDASYPSSCDYD